MNYCINCGKQNIKSIEIGLNKKLINRNIEEFLCLDCLSLKFHCSKERLLKYAEDCKKAGCTLFNY